MKQLLILLVCLSFVECNNDPNYTNKAVGYATGATVILVGKCQYVIYQGNNNGDFAMVHAGDCDNPIHNNK